MHADVLLFKIYINILPITVVNIFSFSGRMLQQNYRGNVGGGGGAPPMQQPVRGYPPNFCELERKEFSTSSCTW